MTRGNWRAFPDVRKPRLLIGPDDKVANALRLYNPYSLLGRWTKSALASVPEPVGRRLLPRVSDEVEVQRLNRLADSLREAVGWPDAIISFTTGTPGADRKWTAQLTRPDGLSGYAKLGYTDAANRLLTAEQSVLQLLSASNLAAAVPTLLHFGRDGEHTVMIQSGAPGKLRPSGMQMTQTHWELLVELARISPADVDCASLVHAVPLSAQMAGSHLATTTWDNVRTFILDRCGRGPVRTHFAHGDFAPWNMGVLETGQLYVFDWEYGQERFPALHDLIHFHFMPLALVAGASPRATIDKLLAAFEAPAMTQLLALSAITPEQVPAYILLYLMRINQRPLALRSSTATFTTDCAHHLLVKSGWRAERTRVLMAAYACEPDQGSEPGVGWNTAQAASVDHDVWVVTRANNRPAIEKHQAEGRNPALQFVYVDLPAWARFWKRGGRGVRTYYYLWQLLAWWRCRQLLHAVNIDVGHHVTFVNDWMYSFLGMLPLRFVWGPVGSNPPVPAALAANRAHLLKDRLRVMVQHVARYIDPLYWVSLVRARVIITLNRTLASTFPLSMVSAQRLDVNPAIGVEELPTSGRTSTGHRRLEVLTVGKLIPVKGMHLAVMAFAGLARENIDCRLRIIGKGPEESALRKLIREFGIMDRVRFDAWAPRDEVLAAMGEADVLLFPSFEGAGMVVLEAMASGLPVVCLDFGGPGELVADGCGIKVAVGELTDTVADLTRALCHYAQMPEIRERHGDAARDHVARHYLWKARSARLADWYRRALND